MCFIRDLPVSARLKAIATAASLWSWKGRGMGACPVSSTHRKQDQEIFREIFRVFPLAEYFAKYFATEFAEIRHEIFRGAFPRPGCRPRL